MKFNLKLKPRGVLFYFALILIFSVANSCNYYVVKNLKKDKYVSINEMDKAHKYFIVHHKDDLYKMENISVDANNLSGNLGVVQRHVYYSEDRSKSFSKEERSILREVHIYLNDESGGIETGSLQIPLSNIEEFKIIKKDTGRDVAAYVVGIGAVAALVAIISSSGSEPERPPNPNPNNPDASCGCPYIYVNDGQDFVFEGEALSAAFARNLERDDYMPLPSIKPTNNSYRIKITNELRERQFLDLTELMVINHPKESKVLMDKYGKPHLLKKSELPLDAVTFTGQNLKSTLNSSDRKVYFFNDEDYSENGVLLKFKKPQKAKVAKLVLNAKNTLWAEHVYSIYASKYGKHYNKWMDNQETLASSQRMDLMLGHDIQLSVYLKHKSGWKLVDYVLPVGLYSPRNLVIPIDISDLNTQEIEIKVETGFMFWELDYAAIDFTQESATEPVVLKPQRARDLNDQDLTVQISESDGKYVEQIKTGEMANLIFKAPFISDDQIQSVFFHCRGYYEIVETYEGKPDRATLKQFRKPGFFSEFSRAIYLNTLDKDYYDASLSMN